MFIKFMNEEIQLEETLSNEEKVGIIIDLIAKAGTTFSHLKIDSVVYEQDYETYLSSHIHQINNIELVTKQFSEMLADSTVMAKEYLERAIPEITVLANGLYQGRINEAWEKITQFIEGLQWLLKIAEYFQAEPLSNYCQDFKQFLMVIQAHVSELETAMTGSDHVLLADLFTYEFLPAYEALYQGLINNYLEEIHDAN